VTLHLTGNGSSTVTVAQDTSTAVNNVNTFIAAYNTALDTIENDTKYDASTKTQSVLTGDSTIQGIESQLKSMLSSAAQVPAGSTYSTLEDIGISTGALGSAPGSTNHLLLDQSKLTAALQTNASAVFSVLSGLAGTTTLTDASGNPLATGSSWLESVTGTPLNLASSGRFQISYNASSTTNNLNAVFTSSGAGGLPPATGTIAAGSSSAMVPGLVLTAKGAPVAGTEYVAYNVSTAGVLQGVNNYLSTLLEPGGLFDSEQTSAATQTKDVNDQITAMNQRISAYQQTLQSQFTSMEVALAKLQTQGGQLASALGNANSSTSGGALA
jgi:flagellar capping protein FliD